MGSNAVSGLILLGDAPVASLVDYVELGGGVGLETARRLGPDRMLEELETSGLRGRGGAGFPTAVKWRSIAAGGPDAGSRFVVANGAEGEPGTFKDRWLIRHNPFQLIEGVLIAAQTLGAERAFIALKASFETEIARVIEAIEMMAAAGWIDDLQVDLVLGPDEYLFGEEKALLEVIEGEEPLPRLFPPYIYGLFTTSPQMGWSAGSTLNDGRAGSNPTLVNNVETLATIPWIIRHGGNSYRDMGTTESPGTMICTVSGDTECHGVGEFELGTPLAEVIATLGGGLPPGRAVKYVLSGVSNPVIRGDHIQTPLSYEAMEAVGAGLGTGGFIVYDDRTDPAELAWSVSRFLGVESCGQCPACKLGTQHATELLGELDGVTDGSTITELAARLPNVTDAARCFLPSQELRVVSSLMPDIREPSLRRPRRGLVTTKLIELVDQRFVLDDRQALKRPDWTYSQT